MDSNRRASGRANYESGLSAEDGVAESYCRDGGSIAARRWRGLGGEIDLIVRSRTGLIFVEVKKAETLARAAERVTDRQLRRVIAAGEEFLAGEPLGLLTPVRYDVALVDDMGRREIIENVSIF